MNADIRSTVELVRAYVDDAVDEGRGSGLIPLVRTLDSLTEPPRPLEGNRAVIAMEHSIWMASIIDELLSIRVSAVCEHFRSTRGAHSNRTDPWSAVDRAYVAGLEARVTKRMLTAQLAAIKALETYERTGKVGWLKDAVHELEGAVRFERTALVTSPTVAACASEKERLRHALEGALPHAAFQFFTRRVRARIDEAGSDTHGRRDHWLSDYGWAPVGWIELCDVGRHFVPDVQAIYDAELAEKNRQLEEGRAVAREKQQSARATADEASPAMDPPAEPEPSLPTPEPPPEVADDGIDPRVAAILPRHLIAASSVEWRDSPSGPRLEGMSVEMALSVRAEMDRQAALDAARERLERERAEYRRQVQGW